MKTTQAKKKDSNLIVIAAPPSRTPQPRQRSSTFRSGKDYRRSQGKRIPSE
jgi:hypothetical protein